MHNLVLPVYAYGFDRETRLFYALAENPTLSTSLIPLLAQQPIACSKILCVLTPTGKKESRWLILLFK